MPKIFLLFTVALFLVIGIAAYVKKKPESASEPVNTVAVAAVPVPVELPLGKEEPIIQAAPVAPRMASPMFTHSEDDNLLKSRSSEGLPTADRVMELFNVSGPQLPIVETVTYKSRVGWQKGRPAWISDYATHYNTSRHFIARSLNGKPDYLKQDVAEGNRFNVFRLDKNIEFYLLIDLSRAKMWMYYVDTDTNERVLLKTYDVGLGRPDRSKASGILTPLGKYSLGNRIVIYQPGTTGFHNGQKVELIRVFGTRWIPFEKEISNTTAPAKGFGIHGVPWVTDPKTGQLVEDDSSVGKYEGDGCIRLATKDIEELYSIIITKPTTVELVQDFYEAKLPGKEKG